MNKQEYESLKSGDKLKIISLEYTSIGEANLEIGEVVEFVDHHLNSLSDNDMLIKKEDGFSWLMSHKDLEIVKEPEYKVGDKLKIVSLDHTNVGDSNLEIDKVVEFLGFTDDCGMDLQVDCDSEHWSISSKDVEVIKDKNNCEVISNFKSSEKTPIKSDGGSSSYYFTKLPQHMIDKIVETGGIEIKDITRYVYDNDSDCKDITKALKRIQEWKKGSGKKGIDALYDANKIIFFAEELRESIKNDFGDKLN